MSEESDGTGGLTDDSSAVSLFCVVCLCARIEAVARFMR